MPSKHKKNKALKDSFKKRKFEIKYGLKNIHKNSQTNEVQVDQKEANKEKILADAKAMVERLKNIHTGTTQERSDRRTLIKHYQDIIDSYKTFDEFVNQSNEVAEQARREAQEREEREKLLKDQENSAKNEAILENIPKEPVNENEIDPLEATHISNFYNRFDELKSTGTEQVKAEMTDIIKAAGIKASETADTVTEKSYSNILEGLNYSYSQAEATAKMRDVVKACFDNANLSLRDAGLSMKNRIITAQKLADVMLKHYSPVSVADHQLDHYADGYVLKDDTFVSELLKFENVPEDQIEAMKAELRSGFANGLKEDELLEQVNPPENEHQENIQQEPPKQDPPAENQELTQEEKIRRVFGEVKPETKPAVNPVSSEARIAVYEEKLKAYNNMYKLNVDSNEFALSVAESWELITSGDRAKLSDGYIKLNNVFKDTLKKAFDVEKGVAYDEHRLPEYVEIIKSTNELMRSAMYGFTDMYHNPNRKNLFDTTAFGGLNDKDMVKLTVGQSLWSMDQKSDEAWEIQAKEAKNIAENWKKEEKPHEKMIAEMKALVKANEEGIVSRKEMVDKLTAAEWLLENDEKMMIDDPYDPYNKVPNWGNRYWKTLTETREALGIDKHTSMRDMIQADYAASARAVNNNNYNQKQINYYVLDKDVRELADSRDVQMEQFATLSATVTLTKPQENKELEDNTTEMRKRHPVEELNERKIMKDEPKNDKWILEKVANQELTILNQANAK